MADLQSRKNQTTTYMARQREIVNLVTDHTSVNITMHTVETFFAVAEEEGLTVSEYARKMRTSLNTVSRQLLDLGIRNRKGEPGWKLVEPVVDPMDLRSKTYRLTPDGRVLIGKIVAIMERGNR